jgi:hypothetical protein
VGAILDVEQHLERDPITQEGVLERRGVNVENATELGTAEDFGPAIWRLAVEQDAPQAARSSVIADGAQWIWSLSGDYFLDS